MSALRRYAATYRRSLRGGGQGGGLILDKVPSTNLLFAASAGRKLRTAYSSGIYRVTEDGGGTTENINFVSNLVDSAAVAAHCGANTGSNDTWRDQSGRGNHFSQSTDANQPELYDGAALISVGGHPVADFDQATAHYMTRSDAFGLTGSPALDLFAVFRIDSGTAANRTLYSVGPLAGGGCVELHTFGNVTNRLTIDFQNANIVYEWSGADFSSGLHVAHLRAAAGDAIEDYVLEVDGLGVGSNVSETNPTTVVNVVDTGSFIGSISTGLWYWNGPIPEVIMFGAAAGNALTASQAAQVQTELVVNYV